jgi:hypothetical protein
MLKHAKIQTFLQIDTHFEMFLIVHKKKKKNHLITLLQNYLLNHTKTN